MRRREFIKLVGGAAATWPFPALAQQSERMRRVGVLMHTAADDADGQTRLAAFLQGLQETGWAVGRNIISTSDGPPPMPTAFAVMPLTCSR
jgi:putative tryptophan/tyrosine transport system substrate-binding protein